MSVDEAVDNALQCFAYVDMHSCDGIVQILLAQFFVRLSLAEISIAKAAKTAEAAHLGNIVMGSFATGPSACLMMLRMLHARHMVCATCMHDDTACTFDEVSIHLDQGISCRHCWCTEAKPF